jgi:ribosomal protein L32E
MSDCDNLRMMTRLARTAGPGDLATMVASQAEVTCARGGDIRRWENNNAAKLGDDSWRYPNGKAAKLGTVWRYPSGTAAKLGSNWRYPNNKAAKLGSLVWRRPDGESGKLDDLIKWACSRLPPEKCKVHLDDIGRATGDEKDMAVIELAWAASTMV